MPVRTFNNTLKGKFKAPRWVVFGEDRGIPFRKVYRTETAARKLSIKPGITNAHVLPLH